MDFRPTDSRARFVHSPPASRRCRKRTPDRPRGRCVAAPAAGGHGRRAAGAGLSWPAGLSGDVTLILRGGPGVAVRRARPRVRGRRSAPRTSAAPVRGGRRDRIPLPRVAGRHRVSLGPRSRGRVDGPAGGRRAALDRDGRAGVPDPAGRREDDPGRHGPRRRRRRRRRRRGRLLLAGARQRRRHADGRGRGLSPRRVHARRARADRPDQPEPAGGHARPSGDRRHRAAAAGRTRVVPGRAAEVLRRHPAPRAGDGRRRDRDHARRRSGRLRQQRFPNGHHRRLRLPDARRPRRRRHHRPGRGRARYPVDRGRGQPRDRSRSRRQRGGWSDGGRDPVHGVRPRRARPAGAGDAGPVRGRRRDGARDHRGRLAGSHHRGWTVRGGEVRHVHGGGDHGSPCGDEDTDDNAARRPPARRGGRPRQGARPAFVGPVGLGRDGRPRLRDHRHVGRRRPCLRLGRHRSVADREGSTRRR